MTGLIRKDLYCLRKNLKIFFGVTIGVIVIAVLFILSSRFGNVAKGIEEMKVENDMGEEIFYSLFQIAIWLVLLIPVSFLSMIVECFKEDKKAGFGKYLFTLPLRESQMVAGRYASCMLFAVVGLMGSFLAAFFVSLVSDFFSFAKLSGYVLCFSAALLVYMSLVMFLLYLFGAQKADLIQCVPFVILLIACFVFVESKLLSLPKTELDSYCLKLMNSVADFMTQKCGLIFLAALGCMALSFFGSCKVVKWRRENI